jgi:RAB6A-GEF complex partner protein 1
MEWSSDGYVLAVGWQNGWAIFSVGGRCLAWGFGVEDSVDERKYVCPRVGPLSLLTFIYACERFQDIFMFGIRDLVCAD